MSGGVESVLVVCTGNSARSILGEYLLRHRLGPGVRVASAGSQPTGVVHPLALRVLAEDYGIDPSGAASKSVDSLAGESFDVVVTVCDHARDTCPLIQGRKRTLHFGLPDPVRAEGSDPERLEAFRRTAQRLASELPDLVTEPPGPHSPAGE